MSVDIKDIPTPELAADREDTVADISRCEYAMAWNVHTYSGGAVADRLRVNRDILAKIDGELERRRHPLSGSGPHPVRTAHPQAPGNPPATPAYALENAGIGDNGAPTTPPIFRVSESIAAPPASGNQCGTLALPQSDPPAGGAPVRVPVRTDDAPTSPATTGGAR